MASPKLELPAALNPTPQLAASSCSPSFSKKKLTQLQIEGQRPQSHQNKDKQGMSPQMPWHDVGRYLQVTGELIPPGQPGHRGPRLAQTPASPSSRVNELQCWSLERTLCPHSSAQGRECQLLSRRQGLAFLPDAAPKECQPRGCRGEGAAHSGGMRGDVFDLQKSLSRAGRAGQALAHVCCRVFMFTKHCSQREGMAGIHPLAPHQTPRTCRRTRGIRSSSLLPWLHISETQAAKKIKEENQNISMGEKKNRRGKNAEE